MASLLGRKISLYKLSQFIVQLLYSVHEDAQIDVIGVFFMYMFLFPVVSFFIRNDLVNVFDLCYFVFDRFPQFIIFILF